jgi:hypothetical protein
MPAQQQVKPFAQAPIGNPAAANQILHRAGAAHLAPAA